MINRHVQVQSVNIAAVGYEPESNTLDIIFNADTNKVYRYANVTPLQHAQLLNAKSIGSHFAQTIRRDVKLHPFHIYELKAIKGQVE